MKLITFIALSLTLLTSCFDRVDPEVSTKYLSSGSGEQQKASAVKELLDFYTASEKDKPYYEVISKREGRFILNYNRIEQRLTLCMDPGSGWGRQYMNISLEDLAEMVAIGITLEELDGSEYTVRVDEYTLRIKGKEMKYASSAERIQPQTNGDPTL